MTQACLTGLRASGLHHKLGSDPTGIDACRSAQQGSWYFAKARAVVKRSVRLPRVGDEVEPCPTRANTAAAIPSARTAAPIARRLRRRRSRAFLIKDTPLVLTLALDQLDQVVAA